MSIIEFLSNEPAGLADLLTARIAIELAEMVEV
jgi:hypothetical protein